MPQLTQVKHPVQEKAREEYFQGVQSVATQIVIASKTMSLPQQQQQLQQRYRLPNHHSFCVAPKPARRQPLLRTAANSMKEQQAAVAAVEEELRQQEQEHARHAVSARYRVVPQQHHKVG